MGIDVCHLQGVFLLLWVCKTACNPNSQLQQQGRVEATLRVMLFVCLLVHVTALQAYTYDTATLHQLCFHLSIMMCDASCGVCTSHVSYCCTKLLHHGLFWSQAVLHSHLLMYMTD